jgi:hypothetical protein
MVAIPGAKLGVQDVAVLKAFGYLPWCRIWVSGQDVTEHPEKWPPDAQVWPKQPPPRNRR